MDNENIEIQIAKQTIELLNQLTLRKTKQDYSLMNKLRVTNIEAWDLVKHKKYDITKLILGLKKALKLNQYRPKNMSITQLAISDDMDYINGDFDTFDLQLSREIRNKNSLNIVKRYKKAITNLHLLTKYFSDEWIQELNKHIDLVRIAHNTNDKKAYNDLFNVLIKDFCDKHNCVIDCNIVTKMPEGMSPDWLGGHKNGHVFINITRIKDLNKENDNFFWTMMSTFIHEVHHGLDYSNPREGALGPQIYLAVKQGPVLYDNHEYPTEISSYEIARAVLLNKHKLIIK